MISSFDITSVISLQTVCSICGTTPAQNGPGSYGNEGLLHIPQTSKASKNSPRMGFVTRFLHGASQEIKPKSNEGTNSGTKLEARKNSG